MRSHVCSSFSDITWETFIYLFFSRLISPSFYRIFTKTGEQPFSILSASLGLFRGPGSGAWHGGSWIFRVRRVVQKHLPLAVSATTMETHAWELLRQWNVSSDFGSSFRWSHKAAVLYCAGMLLMMRSSPLGSVVFSSSERMRSLLCISG